MLIITGIVNDPPKPVVRSKHGSAWRGGLRRTILLLRLRSSCHAMLHELCGGASGDAREESKQENTDATSY